MVMRPVSSGLGSVDPYVLHEGIRIMFHLSPAVAARVAVRHGVVTRAELLGDGASHNAIRTAVTSKTLVRVHDGVYRLITNPDTFEARCVAACLADQSAVVTGVTAARLWNFRSVFWQDVPIVMVEHDRNPFSRDVLVRRTNELRHSDWVVRPDAIRIASPPRAWFDCARDLGNEKFEAMTEWVIDNHCTVPTLWTMARRLASSGRSGSARVRRTMSARSDWQRPAGSGLELKVLSALEDRGIQNLVRQHPIMLPNGILVHPDGTDIAARWSVEVDHVTWHGGRAQAQQDKGRDRQLRKMRWQVDRITDQECAQDFDRNIEELVELHALRIQEISGAA